MLTKALFAGPVAFFLLMAGSILMAVDDYRVLFNFSDAESSQKWQTGNDGVMGGVFDGQFKISRQTMEFFGTLSLENTIGFLLSDKQAGPFKLEIEWIRVMPTVEAAYGNVSCEGVYPHHLQGVCVDDTAIYWSFTTQLVKTDLRGKRLGKVPVASDLCRDLNATCEREQETRRRILTELFGSGGDSVWMQPPFFCDYGRNIYLGERVYFNFNCVVLDVCEVRIGDDTFFGPAVQIYAASHPMSAQLRRTREFGRPIQIGCDVWVGGGAIICPGVTIGSKTVIGAGSVVTKDIPAGVFAAGNPCRVIREIREEGVQ